MNAYSSIKLGAIGYRLGEPKPLDSLVDTNQAALKKLIDSKQFGYYLDAQNADVYTLAIESIEQTFDASNLNGAQIDLMIFSSDSMASVSDNHRFYQQLSKKFDIRNAYPLIVTMSECASFQMALELAQSSIVAGKAKNVLLVAMDRSDKVSPRSRIVGDGIGVMSDAAASCIVSPNLEDGLILQQVERLIRGELLGSTMGPQQELLTRAEASTSIFTPLLQSQRLNGSDLRQVFCSNLDINVLELFLQESGISRSQIYNANHFRISHCLSCDCLINLRDYVQTQGIYAGESFAFLGLGPVTWGGALLSAEFEINDI